MSDGLNRYGYVGGNPTAATDLTGHRIDMLGDDCSGVPDIALVPVPVPTPSPSPTPASTSNPTRTRPNPISTAGGGTGHTAGWPADTSHHWRGKKLRAYMTKLERHGSGPRHYNLHIQSRDGKIDYHNYHISYGGDSCDVIKWKMGDSGIEAIPDRFPEAPKSQPILFSTWMISWPEASNIIDDLGKHIEGEDVGTLYGMLQPAVQHAFLETAQKGGRWI